MNIVVLVKDVPNPSGIPPAIGPDFRLDRTGPEGGIDPADETGVALAVGLTRGPGGDVTALTMGPESAVRALWKALALGADRAVLVSDDALCGADTLATARTLSRAIGRRPFDLVVAGAESADGATGAMPPALAELLGIPCLTFARAVEVHDRLARAQRQTATGYEVLECPLPALVTVTAGVAEARYPSIRETIAAKKSPLERVGLSDLGLSPKDVVPSHQVIAVEIAPERSHGEIISTADDAATRILDVLRAAGVMS